MTDKQMPAGYRMDFKPADPCYYTPQEYEKECKAGYDAANIWGLFRQPQPGCPSEVEVYKGWCWVRPRYASAVSDMSGFTPLYLGPLLQRGPIDEDVLHAFPSLVEDRLREEHPQLYPPNT